MLHLLHSISNELEYKKTLQWIQITSEIAEEHDKASGKPYRAIAN